MVVGGGEAMEDGDDVSETEQEMPLSVDRNGNAGFRRSQLTSRTFLCRKHDNTSSSAGGCYR